MTIWSGKAVGQYKSFVEKAEYLKAGLHSRSYIVNISSVYIATCICVCYPEEDKKKVIFAFQLCLSALLFSKA